MHEHGCHRHTCLIVDVVCKVVLVVIVRVALYVHNNYILFAFANRYLPLTITTTLRITHSTSTEDC